ncbi:proteinase inhibitor PSI-1.2 [Daucus carota subsp. sativus]|uniref:proteinase inhibitor PSI-1.2 n=1 Tax=Daucus carota subsp. sativus TaxID=79200 RepID=UPI0007EF7C1B|nr:PREDICTED: proteinase inhibitor PSI-1.2 [Daucus carota subsp. sativus]
MSSRGIFFLVLLASGMLLEAGGVAKACYLYCLQVDYMTCPSSGEEKLEPKCNCCLAPKGCTLHLSGGSSMLCSKT